METPYVLRDQKGMKAALADLIGETVCVAWTRGDTLDRHNFEPQISVQGTLEGNSETGKFRILVDDNNYSYFYDDTVLQVGQDNGKRAVVFIG